jgi:hypothetical protein
MSADLEFPSMPGNASQGASSSDVSSLTLTLHGSRIVIEFRDKRPPDESQVVAYRQQLLNFVAMTGCHDLTFNLHGINLVPSRMLGLFLELKKTGHDIELVNVSPFVQDIFRVSKLESFVTICPGPA